MECKVLIFGDKALTDSFLKNFDPNYKNYCENDGLNFKTYSIKMSIKNNYKLIVMNNASIGEMNLHQEKLEE